MNRPVLFFVASLVLAACSSSSSSSTTAGSFASDYCAAYAPCCAEAGLPTDGNQCRAFIGAFAANGIDQAAADQCLKDINANKGKPDFCSNGLSPSSCSNVLKLGGSSGTVPPGGTCSSQSDCAPSTEGKTTCASLYKSGMTIKKCQVMVVGKEGDSPCVATIDGNLTSYSFSATATDIPPKGYSCDVASGIRCDSNTGKCTALGKVGDPCSYDSCAKDLYCPSGASPVCTARKSVGESCMSSSDCVTTAYCDATTNKCDAKTATGGACTMSDKCAGGSCVNGKCASGGLTLSLFCGGG